MVGKAKSCVWLGANGSLELSIDAGTVGVRNPDRMYGSRPGGRANSGCCVLDKGDAAAIRRDIWLSRLADSGLSTDELGQAWLGNPSRPCQHEHAIQP